jgi:low affinity Fe/Cu permease
VTKATGSPAAFILAFLVIIAWGFMGPIFNYSDTWQLVINTGTTIITFLMVFIIQQSQNKETTAIQLKLNELIAASSHASNRLVDVEELSAEDLDTSRNFTLNFQNWPKKSRISIKVIPWMKPNRYTRRKPS